MPPAKPIPTEKRCPACDTVKPASAFVLKRRTEPGRNGRLRLASYCDPCAAAYQRKRRNDDPELAEKNRLAGWRYRLKNDYGMTEADWYVLLESQNYGCAICGARESYRRLSVDHCHKTGKVRGILCDACNHAIGRMEDNPDRLIAAAEFLRRHQGGESHRTIE